MIDPVMLCLYHAVYKTRKSEDLTKVGALYNAANTPLLVFIAVAVEVVPRPDSRLPAVRASAS